jgi:RNA polymerase sigma factor (TIGR02999 family)
MTKPDAQAITQILQKWGNNNPDAWEELIPLVYNALKRKAGHLLDRHSEQFTLNPTSLVHEIYIEFQSLERVPWRSRQHFFAVAALTMRQLIIDHVRARNAQKRGGGQVFVTVGDFVDEDSAQRIDFLALDRSLKELEQRNPDCCRIVELRYFAGLTVSDIADLLNISERNVYYHWNWAKSWLYIRLQEEGSGERCPG